MFINPMEGGGPGNYRAMLVKRMMAQKRKHLPYNTDPTLQPGMMPPQMPPGMVGGSPGDYTPPNTQGNLWWGGKMWHDPYKLYNWAKQQGTKLSMDEFYNRFKQAGQTLGYQGRHLPPGVGQMPPGQMPPGQPDYMNTLQPMPIIQPNQPGHRQMLPAMIARMRRRRPMPTPPHLGPF